MILPTKHIVTSRSLIGFGGQILRHLHYPQTMSQLWERFRDLQGNSEDQAPISYDWFVLTLDLLFLIGAVDYKNGQLFKVRRHA